MSIWTSKIRAALAGFSALALLSGCTDGGLLATTGLGGQAFSRQAPERLPVPGSAVVVAGPAGYCIDTGASSVSEGDSFVLLASCAAVTHDPEARRPLFPALLTVSVFEPPVGDTPLTDEHAQLAAFFTSDEGRAALSRDGDPATVELISTDTQGGAFFLHAREQSSDARPGLGADHWRAIFTVNGQRVSASVLSLRDHPLAAGAGRDTLNTLVARIRRESRLPKAQPDA
ncbi:MAG: hypothetical protein SWN98_18445 [Pseudomonadota bacterium]|jgi:hypothetical protein|nr:hypothetical protein [Pseudomonadota bacterium]